MMVGVSLEYLRGLGIDVWVHRQTDGANEESCAGPVTEDPKILHMGIEATPLSSDRGPGPRFTIRGFRLERVFALMSEDALPDMSLVLDIARAINGFKSVDADNFVFVWPQVEGTDTSWDDAISAFNAFCRLQIGAEDVVLAIGGGVAKLLATENLSKEQVIALDIAPRDATAKYELWQRIRALVQ